MDRLGATVAQASSKKPQTSAKLSYLARYCLFKALQYDLLDFWLAGGEGKRSSDGMEEHIAIVIACIQCKVGLAQQCLNFLPDPQGQGSLRPTLGAPRR